MHIDNKLYSWIILCFFLLSSCSTGFNVPVVKEYDEYNKNTLGAYIEIKVQGTQEKITLKGELISIDNKKLIIRTLATYDNKNEAVRPIGLKDILDYKLYYAKNSSERYLTLGILNSISSIFHGYFIPITLIANLATNHTIKTNIDEEFSYNQKEMPLEKMYRFARFPQGLPSFITLDNLDILLMD